jgi:hypothetical protein
MSDKITLYLDESGKSSLKSIEDPFIITGTVINDKEISSIEGFFTYIKRKYQIDIDRPFHSYDIFENPQSKLSDKALQSLAKSLSEFISLIPVHVRVLEVDKMLFRKVIGIESNQDFKGDRKRKEMKDYPYRVMASILFGWFAQTLKRNNTIGQVVADSRRGADHQLLKTLNICKEGHIPYPNSKTAEQINDHITAICFAEKNYLSGGLEITDLISYVTFFKVRRKISANKNIGIDKIWGVIRDQKNFSLEKITSDEIRRHFNLEKNEVHKYLRQ